MSRHQDVTPCSTNAQDRAPVAAPPASRGMAVQLRGKGFAEQEAALRPGADDVHAAAQRGTAGGGGALPHGAAIQQAFGRHDVSGVRAHQGGEAAAASRSMGAEAYAVGDSVAFAAAPDLHLAAHEAAHVVQQRAGVSLSGGVGQSGDRYEQHADAVADAVVQGKSAEGLLDGMAGGGGAAAEAVQRSAVKSHAGTFTDESYKINTAEAEQEIVLKFTPGDGVDATKIGLVQSVKTMKEGKPDAIDPAARERTTDGGTKIDRISSKNTPVYGSGDLAGGQSVSDTTTSNAPSGKTPELNPSKGQNATYQLGHRYKDGDAWKAGDAGLMDAPSLITGDTAEITFESAATALDGNQKGTWYGSVNWGYNIAAGKATAKPFTIASMGVPTKEFLAAGAKFNGSKVRGTVVPKADKTPVTDGVGAKQFELAATDECEQKSPADIGKDSVIFIKVTSVGANNGKTGYVKVADVKDKGDGAGVKALPMPDVMKTTTWSVLEADEPAESSGGFWGVMSAIGEGIKSAVYGLDTGTRVKVLKKGKAHTQVEVVDGKRTGEKGWVRTAELAKE